MTTEDKINLLQFVTLTGMFIHPVNDKNIISFIHGYELGTKNNCDFTELLKKLLIDKYKIHYRSDGWSGQISELAKKLSLTWVTTFKKTALEIIADEQYGGLDKAMSQILKKRIVVLIERVDPVGNIGFNDSWREEWLSLCLIKSKWFQKIWADNEWIIIQSIDKQVQTDNIFSNKSAHIPTMQLIKLKEEWNLM